MNSIDNDLGFISGLLHTLESENRPHEYSAIVKEAHAKCIGLVSKIKTAARTQAQEGFECGFRTAVGQAHEIIKDSVGTYVTRAMLEEIRTLGEGPAEEM